MLCYRTTLSTDRTVCIPEAHSTSTDAVETHPKTDVSMYNCGIDFRYFTNLFLFSVIRQIRSATVSNGTAIKTNHPRPAALRVTLFSNKCYSQSSVNEIHLDFYERILILVHWYALPPYAFVNILKQ